MEDTKKYLLINYSSSNKVSLYDPPASYNELKIKCYDMLSIPKETKIIITMNDTIIDNDASLSRELSTSKAIEIIVYQENSYNMYTQIEKIFQNVKNDLIKQVSDIIDKKMGEVKKQCNKIITSLSKEIKSENNHHSGNNNPFSLSIRDDDSKGNKSENLSIPDDDSKGNKRENFQLLAEQIEQKQIEEIKEITEQKQIEEITEEEVRRYKSLIGQVKRNIQKEFPSLEIPCDKKIVYFLKKNNNNVKDTINYFEGSKTNSV